MSWIPGGDRVQRRKRHLRPTICEFLESRTLLADGITASPGAPITAVVGIPVTNAIVATYTIADPSGEPGTQWRALINFGDGHSEGPVLPVEDHGVFEFVDTHTYNAPGSYTITVMIAVPGSQKPNDNTVTTPVTVRSPTPPVTPTSPQLNGRLQGSGINSRVRPNKLFHGKVARFSEPKTRAQEFLASIDWGDQSAPTPGIIHARGRSRFVVLGDHRYVKPGIFSVHVAIQDATGREVITRSMLRVIK
jgi:hypothetical protein